MKDFFPVQKRPNKVRKKKRDNVLPTPKERDRERSWKVEGREGFVLYRIVFVPQDLCLGALAVPKNVYMCVYERETGRNG